MSSFFAFFAANAQGILVFGLLVLSAAALLQWLAWMFARGRFQKRDGQTGQTVSFVLADLLAKIINDFRHLLALIIVVIFALALTYALVLVAYEPTGRLEALSKALQAVVSSLGGLIGAIIGYYFGEKAGEKAGAQAPGQSLPQTIGPAAQVIPALDADADPDVQLAPQRPPEEHP